MIYQIILNVIVTPPLARDTQGIEGGGGGGGGGDVVGASRPYQLDLPFD
jgi:hypothetical protein